MERSSDKHAPRLDESMAHDTRSILQGAPVESRAAEERLQEGGEHTEAVMDPQLEDTARMERSDLARHLRPSAFPADRAALLAVASEEHAPAPIVELLSRLPADGTFATPEAVWEALGGQPETRF